ncbi:unnamed protein product, partial [Polarella glacialis]
MAQQRQAARRRSRVGAGSLLLCGCLAGFLNMALVIGPSFIPTGGQRTPGGERQSGYACLSRTLGSSVSAAVSSVVLGTLAAVQPSAAAPDVPAALVAAQSAAASDVPAAAGISFVKPSGTATDIVIGVLAVVFLYVNFKPDGKTASASHILVKSEAEAQELNEQLSSGIVTLEDFQALAKANSTCPS